MGYLRSGSNGRRKANIYDGYVKIYDVRKEKDGKVIEYTKEVVLPDPGELIKFRQNRFLASKYPRFRSANKLLR